MSFPDPIEAPTAFSDYLKVVNLDVGLDAFSHYQSWPRDMSNGRLDETRAMEWCERMDGLLGKLLRVMSGQPEHQGVLNTLSELCSRATTDIERQLREQKDADAATRRKREEERARLEKEHLTAEQEERERTEKLRKLDADRIAIEAVERELFLKKKALQDALVWMMDQLDDDAASASPQSLGKRPRTSVTTLSSVQFNGVVIPKATRRSARVAKTSKKDLFRRLGQQFAAVAKTCEELAEAMD